MYTYKLTIAKFNAALQYYSIAIFIAWPQIMLDITYFGNSSL